MIENKLTLIGRGDQQRWRKIVREGGDPRAALESAAHEQAMVDQQARDGDVMTVRAEPPQTRPIRRKIKR